MSKAPTIFCLICFSFCLTREVDARHSIMRPKVRKAGARHSAMRPKARKEPWWQKRFATINNEVKAAVTTRRQPQVVFIGDSITQGWANNATWQRYYKRRNAINLGIGGDQTGHVLYRLQHRSLEGLKPKVAVLLIGVNNAFSPRHRATDIAGGIRTILRLLQKRMPKTKVLLLGIFPSGRGPNAVRTKTNRVNRMVARYADNERIFYLDLGKSFLGPKGRLSHSIAFDYLHLTKEGYRRWAKAMEPTLRRLLR